MNLLNIFVPIALSFQGNDSLPGIDQLVHEFMSENNVPGLSLGVSYQGKKLYSRAYGFADRESGKKVNSRSLFRIASISKPVTSIAIMQLVESGKLKLNATVFGPAGILGTKYGHQPYKAEVKQITIHQLLQHISGGWGNRRNDPMFSDSSLPMDKLISVTVDSLPLENAPGTKYSYSNFGYCVLGRVIEKLTGENYEGYVKRTILQPAGITDMQVGGNGLADRRENEVKYYGQGDEDPYCCNIRRMDSHGGWIASAEDLLQILARVDGDSTVPDILSPDSRNQMLTPPVVSPTYACGWIVDAKGNFSHNGSLPGTSTNLFHKANGYGYAVLLNTRGTDSISNIALRDFFNNLQVAVEGYRPAKLVKNYLPAEFADSNRAERMEAAFPIIKEMYRKYAEKHHIPGLTFGLVNEGKLVYADGIGTGNIDKKIAATPHSVYRIASMTKSFAALAIIKLRDAGKLHLDDPVSKYIPEFDSIAALTSDAPSITIRNLLTHTAGFPEDNPWGDRQLQRTDHEFIEFLKKGVSMSSTPGLEFEYANLGFATIGALITRISGEHYEDYIRKNIFGPLGMTHTYWEYSDAPDSLLAQGYRFVNGNWRQEEMLHSGAYGAMGGMLTSIEDFSKYISFHLSAWPPRSGGDTMTVKRSSLREMQLPGLVSSLDAGARNGAGKNCPTIDSYNFGLGWSKDCTGKTRVGHSGGLPGFGSNWTILPDYGIGLVSFCNLTYEAASFLNERIMDTLIHIAKLEPRRLPVSDILQERKLQLLKVLPDWENAQQSGIFAENFFLDYFVDSLKKEAHQLYTKAGRILKVGEIIPENQLRGTFLLEGRNINILIGFTLSPENPALIQAYFIREISKTETTFSKYGLRTISDPDEYSKRVAKDSSNQLVPLDRFIPGIKLDVRYATSNNLMKQPVYDTAAAFLLRPAAEALKKVQSELNKMGYGLKIFDGYRPYQVTVRFYETFHDTVFVASPYTGSRHNRGCAVDLTIINLKTGKELAMPTPYDAFSPKAQTNYAKLPSKVIKNRELFKKVMTENGFDIYPDEWWHFDFGEWRKYPVLDIPFEALPY